MNFVDTDTLERLMRNSQTGGFQTAVGGLDEQNKMIGGDASGAADWDPDTVQMKDMIDRDGIVPMRGGAPGGVGPDGVGAPDDGTVGMIGGGIDDGAEGELVDTVQLRDLIREQESNKMIGGPAIGGAAADGELVDTVQLRDLLQKERNQMRGGGVGGGAPSGNRKTDNERWVDRVNMFGGNIDTIVSLEPPRLKPAAGAANGAANELVRNIVQDVRRGSDRAYSEQKGGAEQTIDSYAVRGIREVNSLQRFFK